MGELVLLVVAAAWAAVLIPPLLRSRIENRPNSSVTDFRRQLNKLQSTVPSRAASPMRTMARPLAQSPGQRASVVGRSVQQANLRRGAGGRSHGGDPREQPRQRMHGDPSGGFGRPEMPRRTHSVRDHRIQHDHHRDRASDRMSTAGRPGISSDELRRRRGNVLVALVLTTAATFFLAASTKAQLFYYLFALSFLALFGFAFLLSQARQREGQHWPSDWMHR
jgi:hypothetical protein